MKLSVIIPAYNEALRLPQTLNDAYAWLDEYLQEDFEMIIVDDGSSDDTCHQVETMLPSRPQCRLIAQGENQGKGAAVRLGMLQAHGDIRVFMDADHSTHIREIIKAFAVIEGGTDIVIASRQHPQSDISCHQSWLREHMGMSFNILMHWFVDLQFKDTQCGFKVFTAHAANQVFARAQLNGFSFDVEILYLARRLNFSIDEIPVQWINRENSRVRILIDPAKMFLDIMRIRRMHQKTLFP